MARRPSGFTLIELMLVVAITGILASVALPELEKLQLRARQAERAMMMTAIHRSIEDGFLRASRFPGFDPAVPGVSFLFLDDNPTVPAYTPAKKPWRHTAAGDHWNDLNFRPEGSLYYVYSGVGRQVGALREYHVVAYGDLDSDGVFDIVDRFYSYSGTTLATAGSNCLDCTWEDETPPAGASY